MHKRGESQAWRRTCRRGGSLHRGRVHIAGNSSPMVIVPKRVRAGSPAYVLYCHSDWNDPIMATNNSISVDIYGQTYNVRGEGDPAYLTELARFVDARMHEVASQVMTTDVAKIAILAALNIADECSRSREDDGKFAGRWVEKTERMIARLDETIVEGSTT